MTSRNSSEKVGKKRNVATDEESKDRFPVVDFDPVEEYLRSLKV